MNIDWNNMVHSIEPSPCLILDVFHPEQAREALFYGVNNIDDVDSVFDPYQKVPYILVRFPEEEHVQWLNGYYYTAVVYESEEAKINFLTQKGLKI